MSKRLEKAQTILVSNVSEGQSVEVCAYGTTHAGRFSAPKIRCPAQCLAGVTSDDHRNAESFFIWSGPKGRCPEESRTAYLDWILGEASPWKSLLTTQEYQDPDFIRRYGYVLTDLNYPANLVVNFLTAYRLPIEKQDLTVLWDRLVRDGVSKGCSLLVTGMVSSFNPRVDSVIPRAYDNHHAIESHVASSKTVARLNSGEPDPRWLSKWNFFDNTAYIPCNRIWGYRSDYRSSDMINQSKMAMDVMMKYASGGKSHRRVFSDPHPVNNETLSYQEVLDYSLDIDSGIVAFND